MTFTPVSQSPPIIQGPLLPKPVPRCLLALYTADFQYGDLRCFFPLTQHPLYPQSLLGICVSHTPLDHCSWTKRSTLHVIPTAEWRPGADLGSNFSTLFNSLQVEETQMLTLD